MRHLSFAAVGLLVGCGVEEGSAYRCPIDFKPGFIGADWELPCEQVQANAALARRVMSEAAPNFGDRLIHSIVIRDVESWLVEGSRAWGTTSFDGTEARVRLGRSMWSLVHEMGHVYLMYSTGDSDHAHARWDVSGQRGRDAEYQRAYEPLPASANSEPSDEHPLDVYSEGDDALPH